MLKLGLLSLTLAIVAACGVYSLKHDVQVLDRERRQVERQIEATHLEIKRLKAEWATLSRPERLARLAETHLGLKPAEPRQLVTLSDVPLRDGPETEGGPALVSSYAPSPEPASRAIRQ